jgi:glycogen operon protein
MITGGDELFRTQYCNNNPYNLDSDKNWLDWSNLEEFPAMQTFAGRLFRFRRAHPALRPADYRTDQVTWHRPDGAIANAAYLDDPAQHALAWRIDGAAYGDSARSIFVAYTGDDVPVRFILPDPAPGHAWFRWIDTGAWMEPFSNGADPGQEYRINQPNYDVEARSVAVFTEQPL